jgi:hypothetical protein
LKELFYFKIYLIDAIHGRDIVEGLRLFIHYDLKNTKTSNECFNSCDDQATKCAAATFTIAEGWPKEQNCIFFKYGFTQKEESDWNAYIKPVVQEEMDRDPSEMPGVDQNQRYKNHFDAFDALTPSMCFKKCKNTIRCGAASFTVDSKWLYNCYLFALGKFDSSDEDLEMWISYTKTKVTGSLVQGIISHPPPSSNIVINNIQNSNIESGNTNVQDTNNGNTHVSKSKIRVKS